MDAGSPPPDPESRRAPISASGRDAALLESEARYRQLFEAVPVGLYRTSREGRILDANPALVALLGYPDLETLQRTDAVATYVDVEARMRWRAIVERDGVVRGFETPLYRMDGTVVWTRHTAHAVRDAEGRVVTYEGAIEDITARRGLEEALRNSEAYYRALTENAAEVVYVVDAGGTIRHTSGSAGRVLGLAEGERVGGSIYDLVEPSDRESARRAFQAMLSVPDRVHTVELQGRHRDGTRRTLEVTGRNLLSQPAVEGIVLNLRDVTERRQLEEQFRQAQKMEAVGRLAGGVAHDFNNLLTVIKGHAALMLSGPPDPAADRESLGEIQRAAGRAAELTNQLLAFSRKQVLQPRVLDLNESVGGIQRMLARVIGEDVELVTDLEPQLWSTLADPGQIEQVVLNLAVNARDAMPDGGVLRVETRNERVAHDSVTSLPPGDYVRLEVGDTGVGMLPDVQSRIFEPFFTTKDVGQGTGLGLAMVHGIVQQSGGLITVESHAGVGTRFAIHLARHDAPAAPAPESRASEETGGSETILLVEDDSAVRLVAARVLRQAGYTVHEARNGAEAVRRLHAIADSLDLLLTDAVMPGMPGSALADRVREHRPDVRVLFTSGYTQDAALERTLGRPGVGFLPKPFAPGRLLSAVRAVLDR